MKLLPIAFLFPFLATTLFAQLPEPFEDHFEDGNLGGWILYDLDGLVDDERKATLEVREGQLHLTAGPSIHQFNRRGLMRSEGVYTNLHVQVDVVKNEIPVVHALYARISNEDDPSGFGKGYSLLLNPNPQSNRFELWPADWNASNNGGGRIGKGEFPDDIIISEIERKRIVFEGRGSTLTASLYDLDNLAEPLGEFEFTDDQFASGRTGFGVLTNGGSSIDTTFDDFITYDLSNPPMEETDRSMPFQDNFDDNVLDPGWAIWDPNAGDPAEFRLEDGVLRNISGPAPSRWNEQGLNYLGRSYEDFHVQVDVVAIQGSKATQGFGLFARMSQSTQDNIGAGYAFFVNSESNRLEIYAGDFGPQFGRSKIHQTASLPDRIVDVERFRLVFEGTGTELHGTLYDLENLEEPLGEIRTTHSAYSVGSIGLFTNGRRTASFDVSFDNFLAYDLGDPPVVEDPTIDPDFEGVFLRGVDVGGDGGNVGDLSFTKEEETPLLFVVAGEPAVIAPVDSGNPALDLILRTGRPSIGNEPAIAVTALGLTYNTIYKVQLLTSGAFTTSIQGQEISLVGPLITHEFTADAPTLNVSNKADLAAGHQLLGTHGGVNCAACHNWGDKQSPGIPGPDISDLDRRLRSSWFRQSLLNPSSYRPGTLMPPLWPGGQSTVPDILGGDTEKQIAAIWTYIQEGKEPPKGYVEKSGQALNHALKGLPEDRVRFHTCYGINIGPRVHEMNLADIVDIMLKVNAGAYLFEAGNPRHEHEWTVWKDVKVPEGKSFVPGVISHTTPLVEHSELIAQRIIRFAEVVGRENVMAGSDCGFASFAATEQEIHPSIVWAKFKNLAEGAAIAGHRLEEAVVKF